MLGEVKTTSGIGAKTAHNIPYTSTKKPLQNRLLTSVTNAKQKNIIEFVNVKGIKQQVPFLRFKFKAKAPTLSPYIKVLEHCRSLAKVSSQ
jgi:hypothetical protein